LKARYEDFLNELVILEKKYLLYSHGHDFVNQAVLDLLRTIGDIHRDTPSIKIVDTGYSLVINEVEFSMDDMKVEYLMHLLGGRGIFSITFDSGVGFSSIVDFLYLLNSIPTNSKLLYHDEIQLAIHNIDFIEVQEVDYGKLKYLYKDKDKENIESIEKEKQIRLQLYEELKSLNPEIQPNNTDEMIDMTLDRLSQMPQAKAQELLKDLSAEVVSKIIERVNVKANLISPSLIDLLFAMDTARKLVGEDRVEDEVEEISSDQVNKLVERESYELYVTEDYRQHLRSLLAYDAKAQDEIKGVEIFDKTLINRTIVTALLNLTKNKLDTTMEISFADTIKKYLEEFISNRDWDFIQSVSNEELVSKFLKRDNTVKLLSETIRENRSYNDEGLLEVIKISGPKNINWLVDSYLEEDDSRIRRGILKLIQPYQEEAAIYATRRLIEDPTTKIGLLNPLIKDHLGSIPMDLASRLILSESIDSKLLAMRIQLTQGDEGVKKELDRLIIASDCDLALSLLDLVKDFRITEVIGSVLEKIKVFYIDHKMYKYIVKTIDTISFIDVKAYEELENKLIKTKISLSPSNLKNVKNYLKGVSHGNKF